MFLAILKLNDIVVFKSELSAEPEKSEQFTARQWITFPDQIKSAIILIGTAKELISEFSLLWNVTSAGKPILKNNEKDNNYYTWANLQPGNGKSYGLTVGLLDFSKVNEIKQNIDIPATWQTKKPSSACGEASQRDLIKDGRDLHTAINSLDDKSEAF